MSFIRLWLDTRLSTIRTDHNARQHLSCLQVKVISQKSADNTADMNVSQEGASTNLPGAEKRSPESNVRGKEKNSNGVQGNDYNMVRTSTGHGQDGHTITHKQTATVAQESESDTLSKYRIWSISYACMHTCVYMYISMETDRSTRLL